MQTRQKLAGIWASDFQKRSRRRSRPHLHGVLDALKITLLPRTHRLARIGRCFGHDPPPALGMAVGKGKVGTLVMAVRGLVKPDGWEIGYPDRIAELGIEQ